MGFLHSVKRAIAREAKATDMSWDGDRGWTVARGKDADDLPRGFEAHVLQAFRRNAVVRAVVTEVATSLSEAPVRAYRMNSDGDFERTAGHPAEELMARPNMRDSYVSFIERGYQHYGLGGNVFMRKGGSGRVPESLRLIRPDRIHAVDVDDDGIPLRWQVIHDPTLGENGREWVPAEEMIHVPDVDPLNEVFGMPRIISALLEVDTDNASSDYVNEVLGNFGSPGTVVSIDGDKVRNKAALTRAEDRWQEKFGPGRGRGKVAFLPGATRVTTIGFSLKDLEFKDLRSITREGICAAFGVDPRLVGVGSASGGTSLSGNEHEEARRKLWTQTIIPLMRRWEAAFNAFLAPDFGDVFLRFDVTDVAALQEDRNQMFERAKIMAQTGGATVPDIRAEMELDPELDDDAVLVLSGNIKYARAGELVPEEPDPEDGDEEDPDDDPDQDPDDDPNDEDEDEEAAGLPVPERKAIARETASLGDSLDAVLDAWESKQGPATKVGPGRRFTILGAVADGAPGDEDRGVAWKQFDDFARSQEPIYRMAAERMFERQRRETAGLAMMILREEEASGDGPAESKGITRASLDRFRTRLGARFDDYHRAWRARFEGLMSRTVDVVAGRLAGSTGLSFDVTNPLITDAIADRANMIVDADARTFRVIMDRVEAGFTEGLGRDQIANRIREVFDRGVTTGGGRVLSAAERARLIATTETTAVSNAAAVRLMRTTDIPWVKIWLSQGDDRVRQAHRDEEQDSHENPVPLDENFRVTGLDAPSEPACRCTVLMEQPEDPDSRNA